MAYERCARHADLDDVADAPLLHRREQVLYLPHGRAVDRHYEVAQQELPRAAALRGVRVEVEW